MHHPFKKSLFKLSVLPSVRHVYLHFASVAPVLTQWIWAAVVATCFKQFGLVWARKEMDLSTVAEVGDSFFNSICVDLVAQYHSGAADGGGGGYTSTPYFRNPGDAH